MFELAFYSVLLETSVLHCTSDGRRSMTYYHKSRTLGRGLKYAVTAARRRQKLLCSYVIHVFSTQLSPRRFPSGFQLPKSFLRSPGFVT